MLWDTFPVESITEEKTSPPVLQPVGGGIPLMNDQWKRGPCFSCGLQGHGVNRCSYISLIYCRGGLWMCRMANAGLPGYAEMDGTVSWEKRNGSGGRVSLPDHR